MNNFLEYFSCKREEVKHCFDKCGFWKTKEEMETYYTGLRMRNFEKSEKILRCSLYNEENIKRDCKLRKLYEQRLLDCLLYSTNFKDGFKEIHDLKNYKNLTLSKQFIINGKKVKIRIHENIRNDKNNLTKIDKLKLDNFMKYGHYNTYDEIKNYINNVTLKGIDDDYIEKLNKELNKIIT